MDILMIVLRLVHIFGGVVWVGGSFANVIFIEPALEATGPEGRPFAARFLGSGKFGNAMAIAAVSTVLAGLILYWRASNGLNIDWLRTGQGIMFTIGGLAGLTASGIGMLVIGRTGDRLSEIYQEIATAGKPPSPEQISLAEALQRKMAFASRLDLVVMIIAVIGMATARYVTFTL